MIIKWKLAQELETTPTLRHKLMVLVPLITNPSFQKTDSFTREWTVKGWNGFTIHLRYEQFNHSVICTIKAEFLEEVQQDGLILKQKTPYQEQRVQFVRSREGIVQTLQVCFKNVNISSLSEISLEFSPFPRYVIGQI